MARNSKEAQRIYDRRYRKRHADKRRGWAKAQRRRQYDFIAGFKAKPCMDCKIQYPPYVMHFDHVRGKKEFNIGMTATRSRARLLAEMAKCELVCANCHAARTWIRQH